MLQQFYRTSILLDDAKINELTKKHVLVAGVGGVGGYAVEALVRAGIGQITIIDNDTVDITNINRQLIALLPDVGRVKVELFRERIKLINPQCSVYTITEFLDENNVDKFIPCSVDYVIDCIDTVDSKVSLIKYCYENKIKIVSSQGAGNRYDIEKVKIADISKTHKCPLAKLIRLKLRKLGINNGIKVVYSEEHCKDPLVRGMGLRPINGTISYMPALFGIILSGIVLKELIDN